MPEHYDNIANVHLDAVEHGDDIIFMHSVKPGPANQSYGLQVAKLAGIPAQAIRLARQKLQQLEQQAQSPQADLFSNLTIETPDPVPDPALDALAEVDPDELSPRDALELIYRLKQLAKP